MSRIDSAATTLVTRMLDSNMQFRNAVKKKDVKALTDIVTGKYPNYTQEEIQAVVQNIIKHAVVESLNNGFKEIMENLDIIKAHLDEKWSDDPNPMYRDPETEWRQMSFADREEFLKKIPVDTFAQMFKKTELRMLPAGLVELFTKFLDEQDEKPGKN